MAVRLWLFYAAAATARIKSTNKNSRPILALPFGGRGLTLSMKWQQYAFIREVLIQQDDYILLSEYFLPEFYQFL